MIDTTMEFFLKNAVMYLDMAAKGEKINVNLGDGRTVTLTQAEESPNRAAFK